MGTGYSVQLSPPPDQQTLATLQRAIDQRLLAINAMMSTYLDASDLMRFNRSRSTDWQLAPIEIVALVRRAEAISIATGGYYDITTGPLVNLWGFGNTESRQSPPPTSEITATLQRVGHEKLLWREDPPSLRKLHPGIEIDLSSIAKGWAVDELGKLLQQQGLDTYLIDIGGETLARGQKVDGEPWRIAVERPSQGRRLVQGGLLTTNLAVATSGDYRNFFAFNNQRYSHTVNPKTGRPVRHRLASVTVVADNAADADAWATALLALGDSDGPALAEALDLAALFIMRDGDEFHELTTSALRALEVWQSQY
jgi:thiamine biosynthesis lipoprotein